MEFVFYFVLILLIYPYGLYPIIVRAWAKCKPKVWHEEDCTPPVTLIISVYNEERVIHKKIMNSLQLDYPADLLEILVSSDGSDDSTNRIVSDFDDSRVVLKSFPERRGKTACLNRVVPQANGDIILFTDANSMLPAKTLINITKNFADHEVGLVTGWTKYQKDNIEETTGFYSRFEKMLKLAESKVSSCVGADGAIFAMRKELFVPLKEDDINDFVMPLNTIGSNKRVVLDPDVFCVEEAAKSGQGEFKRQVRITNRTLGAIARGRCFLNPVRYGSFAIFLLSHKLLRFLMPFSLFACIILAAHVYSMNVTACLFLLTLFTSLMICCVSLIIPIENRILDLNKFFILTIMAQLIGWIRFVSGKTDILWTPQR